MLKEIHAFSEAQRTFGDASGAERAGEDTIHLEETRTSESTVTVRLRA